MPATLRFGANDSPREKAAKSSNRASITKSAAKTGAKGFMVRKKAMWYANAIQNQRNARDAKTAFPFHRQPKAQIKTSTTPRRYSPIWTGQIALLYASNTAKNWLEENGTCMEGP